MQQYFELNEPQFFDGADILKHVYNKYGSLNSIDRLVIERFLQSGEWKRRWNVFMEQNSNVAKVLELNARGSSGKVGSAMITDLKAKMQEESKKLI